MGDKKGKKKIKSMITKAKNSELPGELWIEVFHKLAFKTVTNLRAVCKTFLSIIGNPSFGRDYIIKYSKNNPKRSSQVLLIEESATHSNKHRCTTYNADTFRCIKKLFFPNPLQDYFTIEGYIDGLVLIQNHTRSSPGRGHWCLGDLKLCNPSLRKSAILPSPTFSPCPSNLVQIGFGFDSSTQDHKVVFVKYPDENIKLKGSFQVRVEILGLGMNSWRSAQLETTFLSCEGPKVFVNGAIHWLGRNTLSSSMSSSTHIISFHLRNNSFSYKKLPTIDQPSESRSSDQLLYVILLRGSLALVDCLLNKTYIWTMSSNSWTQSYTIDLVNPRFHCEVDDGELLYLEHNRRVTYFDLKSMQILVPSHNRSYFPRLKLAAAYVESVVWYSNVNESQLFLVPALTISQRRRRGVEPTEEE